MSFNFNLSEPHRKMLLEESGLSPEVVEARGYWTAQKAEELKRLGFSGKQRLTPALVMPVFSPTGEISMYLSRPDEPRLNGDGKPIKYEIPTGSTMALDVPDKTHIGDPSKLLFVSEGIKKADALALHGLTAVDLIGVWNFRGRNAHGGKVALAEWEWVALNARKTYIVFDSDVMTKPEVYKALVRLKDLLEHRGAKVKLIYLPAMEDGSKQGVDDYLAAGHTVEGLYELATDELKDPPALEGKGLTAEIADEITAEESFARDVGDKLYYFSEGVYKPGGERRIRTLVKHLLNDWGMADKWTSHRANEVAAYILADVPELWESPPQDRINVANGILDLETWELEDHDPDFLSPVQIPVNYVPGAACPAWERQVEQTFPEDARALAWEIAADLIQPDRSDQKAILLTGEGSNGKSVFLENIAAFLGRHNRSSRSLHRLESDRFAVSSLMGKLANICPDLPSGHLTGTSMFKAITGGDTVSGEYKYKDQFDFVPFCRLLFSANRPPTSGDDTHAFFRRWKVVPFERTFDPDEAAPRERIDAALQDPRELSGLLNKALEALPRLKRHGFSEPESVSRAHEEFRETTDPLAVWLNHNTVEGPEMSVPKGELREAYAKSCEKQGRTPPNKTEFGRALKRLRPDLREGQRVIGGRKGVECYLGIGLRTDGPGGGDGPPDPTGGDDASGTDKPVKPVKGVSPTVIYLNPGNSTLNNNRGNRLNSLNSLREEPDTGPGPKPRRRMLTAEETHKVQKLITEGYAPKAARAEVTGEPLQGGSLRSDGDDEWQTI